MTVTEINVPNHMQNPSVNEPNPNPVGGPCVIFIVTYWKDFQWLKYCLQSIAKFARGFAGVTLAVPSRDIIRLMNEVPSAKDTRVIPYEETEGKGMVQHMEVMSRAHEFVPDGTHYILHHDADGIFNQPVTPEHFFSQDKPHWLVRPWESLVDGSTKVVSDCMQWRQPTDAQIGFASEVYTMCLNTQMIPVEFYPAYRAHLESLHGSLHDYFCAGKNSFPQDRMDFTAMGAFAHKHMHDRFTWFDVSREQHPPDRKKAFWSHGGITPEIQKEIESILN